jgi:hypothetical protein
MSKTWEDRPLSKAKMAMKHINEQLNILQNDIDTASRKNNLSLLERIDVIEDWYALKHIACKEKEYECKDCPFLESITTEWDGSKYEDYYDCKFEFGSGYAGDIIPYIEKYRTKIDQYKKNEDDEEIHSTMEWKNRFQK